MDAESEGECLLFDLAFVKEEYMLQEKKYEENNDWISPPYDEMKLEYHSDTNDEDIVEETEENTSELSCQFCGDRFHQEVFLVEHEKKHCKLLTSTAEVKLEYDLIACPMCQHRFSNNSTLERHVKACKTVHAAVTRSEETNLQIFECPVCFLKFRIEHSVMQHIVTHIKASKSYSCWICGNAYNEKKHLDIHTKLCRKNYVCELHCRICGKKFFNRHSLDIHIFTHIKDRLSFRCNICGNAYMDRSTMRSHRAGCKLNKDIPATFKCNICGNKYHKKLSLSGHINYCNGRLEAIRGASRADQETNRYRCSFCSKTFKHKFTRNRHMIVHREGQSRLKFPCHLCGKCYAWEWDKMKHLKTCRVKMQN